MMRLKYSDGTILTNEDLVACYPRRIEKKENYEIWQFPYVKNEVLHDEDDIIGISFIERTNKIFLISKFKHRLEDLDFINRIISLVHDVSDKFEFEKHLVTTDPSLEEVLRIMEE